MNEVFFTSDHHFGHRNIIDYCDRPWRDSQNNPDVPRMNIELVERWNETVMPNDTVYYVGDFAMGGRENVEIYGPMLNGNKHLISGNHDRCWLGHKKGYKNMDLYLDAGFITIQSYLVFDGYLVNHFPYEEDPRHGGQYSGHRPSRDYWLDRPLIHGHVHEEWKAQDNQVNVGIDVWDYRPAHYDEVRELF